MEPILIYIADNQHLSFLGLNVIFRSFYGPDAIIEQVTNKELLEHKVRMKQPNLIAIDYANIDFIGISEFIEFRHKLPHTHFLVISDNKESKQIKEILKAGFAHYIFKSAIEDDFYNALKAIQNNRKYICSELYDIILQKERKYYDPAENIKLSASETEIVRMIANGKSTKEIAEIKLLSFHTINTHRKNIFRKLNINNASELVKYAINTGIINNIEYYI